MSEFLPEILIAFLCLAAGGVLKGATGAGAPVLAVPALAMMFDVRVAVVTMLVPNLLTNVWQAWQFRGDRLPNRFILAFSLAGAIGVVGGTVMLAAFSPRVLLLIVAIAVLLYIAARLARPDLLLSRELATRLAVPAGAVAGVLQGSGGLSAPVSLTFLNAMGLTRTHFISTVSIFFAVMTLAQVPMMGALGLLTWQGLALSFLAMLPILAFMPVGAALARRFSKEAFDRAILALLSVLAIKLIYDFAIG